MEVDCFEARLVRYAMRMPGQARMNTIPNCTTVHTHKYGPKWLSRVGIASRPSLCSHSLRVLCGRSAVAAGGGQWLPRRVRGILIDQEGSRISPSAGRSTTHPRVLVFSYRVRRSSDLASGARPSWPRNRVLMVGIRSRTAIHHDGEPEDSASVLTRLASQFEPEEQR